jgi:serine/threonine protein phosphatase PrpC
MEDEVFVGDAGSFVAVFDGHGGGEVSHYLREKLYGAFRKQLERKKWEQHPDDKLDLPASLSVKVSAVRAAFEQIEAEVLKKNGMQHQGSTAVAVLIHENEDGNRTLLSANVGDSRAILSRNKKAVALTRDHKPSDEREKARILAMGEIIEWDHFCKVHRVRNLSLARAIGDRFAKPVVTAEVEIKHFPVQEGDDFVVLASDGLWDVMSNQDVVSFVYQKLDSMVTPGMSEEDIERMRYARRKFMAHYLATEALKLGSADNVSVVVLWLNKADLK